MYRLAVTPPWRSCAPDPRLLALTSKSAKSWTMSTYSVSMVDSQCLLCHILSTVLSDTQFNGLWDFIINIYKCHDLKYLFTVLPSRAWGLEMMDLEWFSFLSVVTPQRGGKEGQVCGERGLTQDSGVSPRHEGRSQNTLPSGLASDTECAPQSEGCAGRKL